MKKYVFGCKLRSAHHLLSNNDRLRIQLRMYFDLDKLELADIEANDKSFLKYVEIAVKHIEGFELDYVASKCND